MTGLLLCLAWSAYIAGACVVGRYLRRRSFDRHVDDALAVATNDWQLWEAEVS